MVAGPAVALLLAAAPLDCPPGTTLKGGAPPDLFEAWCEGRPDAAGRARRHGPARTWYDDGAPWTEAHFTEGRRDGLFVEYHRNGKKAREGTWALDEKVGTWTLWFEDGRIEERCEWVRNVPHGPFAAWHRGGARRIEGRYCVGAQCGRWTTWDEGGRELGRVDFGERKGAP